MLVHARGPRLSALWVFAVALLSLGCPESPSSVSVDLQTGYLPGLELGFVQVELAAGSHVGVLPSPRLASRAVEREATGYSSGVRVADFDGLAPGVYTVRVVIRQTATSGAPDSGPLVGDRRVIVNVTNRRVVRVAITADCRNHSCAASGGAFTECLNGVCVAPGCDLDAPDPALCCDATAPGNTCATNPTPCGTSGDCSPVADCVDATCVEGACLRAETDACSPGAFCSSLEMACVEERPATDAGIPDAPVPPQDCGSDPACAGGEAGRCAGGVDDDGDMLTDCADVLDCGTDPVCAHGEVGTCANNMDDDGDGLIDCADGLDCILPSEVERGRCLENGIDDDCDGLTDGNDPQCAGLSCRGTAWWRWCGALCQSTHTDVSCGACEVSCFPLEACRTDLSDREARCGCGRTGNCPSGFVCVTVESMGQVCACTAGSCGPGFRCTAGTTGLPSFCEPVP